MKPELLHDCVALFLSNSHIFSALLLSLSFVLTYCLPYAHQLVKLSGFGSKRLESRREGVIKKFLPWPYRFRRDAAGLQSGAQRSMTAALLRLRQLLNARA